MGFMNDMLSWEQSGYQRKLKDQAQLQLNLLYLLTQHAEYQSARLRAIETLMLDSVTALQSIAEDARKMRVLDEL